MQNKGQSALEYLMTYGWALVVIVIVVAALVVFGVFSTPTNCSQFTGRLLLKDFSVTATGIDLVVQNNSTGTITVDPTDPVKGKTLLTTSGVCVDAAGATITTLAVGATTTCKLTGSLTGKSVNELITIKYKTADALVKTETTTCVATVP